MKKYFLKQTAFYRVVIIVFFFFLTLSTVLAQQDRNTGGADQATLRQSRAQSQTNRPEEAGSSTNASGVEPLLIQERVRVQATSSDVDLPLEEQTRQQTQQQTEQRINVVKEDVSRATVGMSKRAEVLQQRNWLRKFFFGYDQIEAATLQQEAEQNRVRIQEMNQLLVDCSDCDKRVRTALQEQLQTMQQEQDRLHAVAEDAQGWRGIFGWLFGD